MHFTWIVSTEGVGSVVESSGRMTGESDGDGGQHQSSEREHSIHNGGVTETVFSSQ